MMPCMTPTKRVDMWFKDRSVKTTEYSSSPSGSTSRRGRLTSADCHSPAATSGRDLGIPFGDGLVAGATVRTDQHRVQDRLSTSSALDQQERASSALQV